MKKNMKKRILSGLLCLVMSLTLLPTVAMAAGRFTDVKEKDWFYTDVEYAVEQGLVNGTTPTTYSPNSNLTYGSAIKLAACMHKKVTKGNTDFTVGSPWYQVYVDYAVANGIIPAGKNYDWNANATRAGYMEIFAKAIPDTGLKNGYVGLTAMNTVDDDMIPDVSMSHPQAAAIYKLYRAGILQGSNSITHQCNPDNYIQRSEVATILTRMMNADARISFEMTSGETPSANTLKITQQPADVAVALGEKAQFTVKVSGGKSPYTYKWYSSADGANWTAIVNNSQFSGGATATLTVKANAATPLNYRCEITDASRGSVTSNAAKLTVGASTLAITQQPKDETCKAGNQAAFTVAVSGGKAPYTYQWQIINERSVRWVDLSNNDIIDGAKTNELLVIVTQDDFTEGFQYRCVITDANGNSVTSNVACAIEPTATSSTPKITQQPKDVTCAVGEQAVFTVAVSGGKAPYTYQWQWAAKNSDATWANFTSSSFITGMNTKELCILVTEADFLPGFQYHCVITDANGNSVTSDPVTIIKSASTLKISQQPKNASAAAGKSVSLTVEISGGTSPFTYQWQYSIDKGETWQSLPNSTKYSGVSTSTLKVTIESLRVDSALLYRCKISDAAHTEVYSNSVTATATFQRH